MTTQTIRSFIDHHAATTAGMCALGAALDTVATGSTLDPAIATAIEDLLGALGTPDALARVTKPEAAALLAELRHMIGLDTKLLWGRARTPGWTHTERELLQATGDFARGHAVMLSSNVIPALPGLAERFAGPGATFLDIGVGAAGLAIRFAELWPTAKIVGIDVLQSALSLARDNVAQSSVRDRIEIRELGAEHLADEAAYDLAWVPMPFMPKAAIEAACPRIRRALKPGGWVVEVFPNVEGEAAETAALWRLRNTMWGGPIVTPAYVETMLRDNGFVDVKTLPRPPGVIVSAVAGRRPE